MSPADDAFELDFGGAPPAQGGLRGDHILAGVYRLVVDKGEKLTSKKDGKPMARISWKVDGGEFAGKRLLEYFVFPRPGTEDSIFGLQRFHAALIALGFKQQTKKITLPLSKLVGKTCVAEVEDEEQAATEQYPARVTSRPMAYYREGAEETPAFSPQATQVTGTRQPVTAAAGGNAKGATAVATAPAEPEFPEEDGTGEGGTPPPSAEDISSELDELL